MGADRAATLVEVGPRDGFQPIGPFIPTAAKIAFVERLHAAGVRRMEATAFVSANAIPQLADAPQVLKAARGLKGLDVQVLIPNRRYSAAALEAGADHLVYVLSISEQHNMSNVRRSPADSARDYLALLKDLPSGVRLRLNVATAFDCPFNGPVDPEATLELITPLVAARPELEVALCDTTGRVTPDRTAALFAEAIARFPGETSWVFHGHDTYGLGVANVVAAHEAGVRVFDTSFGGLGGCPFAPGATGNVATEDVVWTLAAMGVYTGVDLEALLPVAEEGARLPGASSGGRIRDALRGARRRLAA